MKELDIMSFINQNEELKNLCLNDNLFSKLTEFCMFKEYDIQEWLINLVIGYATNNKLLYDALRDEMAKKYNVIKCNCEEKHCTLKHKDMEGVETETCKWSYDEYTDSWDTDCKDKFSIISGTPAENNMIYCHFCGKKIVEVEE